MTEHSAATGAGDENPMAAFWLEAKKEWERRFYKAQVEIGRTHRAVPDEFCLDPPDGGDVKPWEAVERMADALAASRQRESELRGVLGETARQNAAIVERMREEAGDKFPRTIAGMDELAEFLRAYADDPPGAAVELGKQLDASRDALRAKDAEIERLRALAADAIEEVESWAGYASDFAREKHGIAEILADLRARAALKEQDQ